MESVVVLGAGPAGMMAGYELSKHKKKCVVFDKQPFVGGLARTLKFDDFLTDIGPHRFYSKKPYLYQIIEELLGDDWIKVNRLSRFYVNGKFYKYPVELIPTLIGVGPYKAFRMVFDYYFSRTKSMIIKKKLKSFEDYAINNFGWTLAKFNMLDYTEKIWGIPCNKMSPDWALQRIGGLSVYVAIKNAVMKGMQGSKKGPATLVDTFYYPKYGAGFLYQKMKEKIESDGNKIMLDSEIVRVNHRKGKVTSIEAKTKDGIKTFECSHCISSIPITLLARIMNPAPPKHVIEAAKKLKHRSQIYIFIELNKKSVTKDNWVYFPDKNIPFGRFYEPRNFSKAMSPKGKTSLMVEYFCFEDDELWKMEDEKLFDFTIKELEKLGFIKRKEVIKCYSHKERFVYPLYTLDYKKYDITIKKYLKSFKNLYYIGRAGRFKYHAQDIALDTGIFAAKSIIEKRKYNIDNIGEENEYAEKGMIKNKRQNLD
ncbi:MAG TPA: FAD-dependent oxidoreductase [Candidatus Nanoarchaeia archaeon]|nr:FAD-dependent oxidoreductase [Candidatus Nanoarchaeia archaeon]